MDYVSRQFVNLTKKFRKELRLLVLKLNDTLKNLSEAIRENAQASNVQQSPPPEVTTVVTLPASIEVHQKAADARHEKDFRLFSVLVAELTLGAIVVYSVLVERQYREMIKATGAAQQANVLAREALTTVQRAYLNFPPNPEMSVFNFPT